MWQKYKARAPIPILNVFNGPQSGPASGAEIEIQKPFELIDALEGERANCFNHDQEPVCAKSSGCTLNQAAVGGLIEMMHHIGE